MVKWLGTGRGERRQAEGGGGRREGTQSYCVLLSREISADRERQGRTSHTPKYLGKGESGLWGPGVLGHPGGGWGRPVLFKCRRHCSIRLNAEMEVFARLLTSPHLTSPHLTSPHLTSPHLTSSPPHLKLTSLQLTSCCHPNLTSPFE
ncbi:unnamed protein product [Danaus chrysippus]|uniref:(African queen) hypothetical protein n=1 Tax=Danaus chrysippus TaxID=151541 RepID=A0A8J2QG77_9NEOP|nr:unnamed protein product [Danaus chrysippus]